MLFRIASMSSPPEAGFEGAAAFGGGTYVEVVVEVTVAAEAGEPAGIVLAVIGF